MTSILEGALERGPFAGEGGRTDATFERAVLSDGRSVVIKHVTASSLVAQFTGEWDRAWRLWRNGVFARVPDVLDHTIITVEPDGTDWIIVMRDIGDDDLGDHRRLSRAESARILSAVNQMHREFDSERFDGGASLDDHYAFLSRERISSSGWSLAPVLLRGWDLFFTGVGPRDVADVYERLMTAPSLLVGELEKRPQTFIHGDVRLHNIGLSSDRVVLYDWELAGTGPGAVDVAWYLIISASRVDTTREQIIEDYKRIAGDRFDPVAWDLACIGTFGRLGWNKAIDIVDNPDESVRARERADLDWWIGRVREALETWSPL